MSPRGRRPGGEDTRAQIVACARAEFAARGYDATSLRAVARAAGVDPALVHHYFDGKAGLFAATMELPVDPRVAVGEVLSAPRERLGEALVRQFLALWDADPGRERLVALLRSVTGHPEASVVLRDFVLTEVFGRVAAHASPRDVERRAALVGSQLVGLALLRYVVEMPGIAGLTPDEIVADLAPTIQRYLVPETP